MSVLRFQDAGLVATGDGALRNRESFAFCAGFELG